jgi:hypothetical protein
MGYTLILSAQNKIYEIIVPDARWAIVVGKSVSGPFVRLEEAKKGLEIMQTVYEHAYIRGLWDAAGEKISMKTMSNYLRTDDVRKSSRWVHHDYISTK